MSVGNSGIVVTPGAPPQNPYCFTSWAQVFADIINVATFVVGVGSGYYRQQTSPGTPPGGGPFVWFQTNSGGGLVRTYNWNPGVGLWTLDHQVPPSGAERRDWYDLEANLPTYDGGDTNAPGPYSGPMWVVDHDFDAKVSIGPGTLPVSGTIVAVTNTGGADQVTLSNTQTPSHTHNFEMLNGNADGNDTASDEGVAFNRADPVGGPTSGSTTHTTDDVNYGGGGVQTPLNLINPYRAIFKIKRTIRVGYASP